MQLFGKAVHVVTMPAAKHTSSWEKHCRSDREIKNAQAFLSSQGRTCVFRWRWCLRRLIKLRYSLTEQRRRHRHNCLYITPCEHAFYVI